MRLAQAFLLLRMLVMNRNEELLNKVTSGNLKKNIKKLIQELS